MAKLLWEASGSLLQATDACGLFKKPGWQRGLLQWQKQWHKSNDKSNAANQEQSIEHDQVWQPDGSNVMIEPKHGQSIMYIPSISKKISLENDEDRWIVDSLQQKKNNGKLPYLQGGRQIGFQFSAMVFLPYRRVLQSRKMCGSREWEFWSFPSSTDRPKTNLGYLWVAQLTISDSTKLNKAENWWSTMSCSIVLTAYFVATTDNIMRIYSC